MAAGDSPRQHAPTPHVGHITQRRGQEVAKGQPICTHMHSLNLYNDSFLQHLGITPTHQKVVCFVH